MDFSVLLSDIPTLLLVILGVPAVLAAYNWAPNTERYRKVARFVKELKGLQV